MRVRNKFKLMQPASDNQYYNIFVNLVFKMKPYIFISMCVYYLISFGLYYLKFPSSINRVFEAFALVMLVSIIVSSYDTISKIRGSRELKDHLEREKNYSEKKYITSDYYDDIKELYLFRTAFDEYWYYAAIIPVIFLLCFGWFDTLFTLYIATLAFHKHFFDDEIESVERIKNVLDKPSI